MPFCFAALILRAGPAIRVIRFRLRAGKSNRRALAYRYVALLAVMPWRDVGRARRTLPLRPQLELLINMA